MRGGVSFCLVLSHNILMSILHQIFRDHYEELVYTKKLRQAELDNISRFVDCGDPFVGGAMYVCPDCGAQKFVPFRCHSRFCPSCGTLYSKKRATAMSMKLLNCTHRHCVFTIPEELRIFFLKNRSLLNCLFHAVSSVIFRMFNKLNKTENFTPGFILVLHTFGRDLKWNPHIHCLISEGGAGRFTPWRFVRHFNFGFMRSAFRTALLDELHSALGDSFKKIKADIYARHTDGFYVRAKPNPGGGHHAIKYISRYLGRPVIASSRIDAYDGDSVTFHYNRHEDNRLVTETVPVLDFMEMLIRHIPEKHFKMVRYYGLYAKHHPQEKNFIHAISKEKHAYFRSLDQWRNSIAISFGYDPLDCPCCGSTMQMMEIWHKKTALYDQLRKRLGFFP